MGTLSACEGAPYVAAFYADTLKPDPNWPSYPDGYGREVFGITPDGAIEQVTTDQRTTTFDLSSDGTELYTLKNPLPILDSGDDYQAQNRTLDIVSPGTGKTLSTAPAPDAKTIQVSHPGTELLTQTEFDAGIQTYESNASKLDAATESLSITTEAGTVPIYPTWSPDNTAIAYIAAPLDQVNPRPQVRVRTIATGEETVVYEMTEPGGILDLTYSPDGTRLLAMETQDDRVDEVPRWVGVEIDIAKKTMLSSTPMAWSMAYVADDQVLGIEGSSLNLYQRADNGFQLTLTAELQQDGTTLATPTTIRVPRCATTG